MFARYFKRSEFACKCGCGFDDIHPEVVEICDDIRDHIEVPVGVTSGCRCESHNAKVGGAPNSWHKRGRAADIHAKGVITPQILGELAVKYGAKGVKVYSGWIHLDNRDGPTWMDGVEAPSDS